MRIVYCLLLPVFLVLATKLGAQGTSFEKISIEHGLSQGMIFDILQTRDGFLWVATKDGLNRYDGYNFKVFANNPFDSCSIAGNTVTVLFEDSRKLLWVGLEGKGVDVYDPGTGRFHHFPLRFESATGSPFLRVQTITEGKDGAIWVLQGKNDLIRITIPSERKTGTDWVKQVETTKILLEQWEKDKDGLINFSVEADGSLTLFTCFGQYRVEAGAKVAKPVTGIRWPSVMRQAIPRKAGGGEGWWLLDQNYRLFWFDHKGLVAVQTQHLEAQQQAYLETDSRGKSWLTLDTRIWQLGQGPQTIDLQKPDWLLDRDATCIQADPNGNIWVGTSGYGLRKINPDIQLFNKGAAGQSIWRLWRSPKGRYFCRKGLIKMFPYDPDTGLLSENPAFPELGDKGIRDICFEPSGAFWLLASHAEAYRQGGFLCRFDSSENLAQTYTFDFNGFDYAKLMLDREGCVWVVGARCQLVRFDPRNARFDYFDYSKIFGENAETVQPLDIVQDGNGTIWLGTQTGLVKCTFKGQNLHFEHIQTDPRNPNGLNHDAISCLLADPARPEAILWLGTKGGGINCMDLRSGQFQHLTIADGFPDQVVYGILPGNENPAAGPVSLWCSTNRGLVKVTPRGTPPFSFDLVRYSVAQGLQDEEFNTQSYFKAGNGELMFGGVNGLNRFFPENLFTDTIAPPVYIVGLEINHQRADVHYAKFSVPVPLEHLENLELSHFQNNVSFEFAALDFTDPSKNRYRYRLVGLDADWVETGSNRFAHFSHLAPGRYTLRVQANNGESAWKEARPLTLIVHPPWYRSGLAYLCYLLLFAWAAWRAYRFQIQRVREREQLAFEHREMERMKALEQMKTNFFNNVTHEFRTPLTLIAEPVRQLLRNPRDPELTAKLRLVDRNSQHLLQLVNQLLDMAKLESGQMSLDLRRGDLGQTVRDVFETFLPLAEKRGVKLTFRQDSKDSQNFEFDPGKVELVLNNLISNALKFTPEGGRVEIILENGPLKTQNSKLITVKDSGIGIAPENLNKVFERFYQVDGSHTRAGGGTGIGLALSKELAELMGGSISVESDLGKGSTFMFWLSAPVPHSAGEKTPGLIPVDSPTNAPALSFGGGQGEARPGGIVLVIEDNPDLRFFIKTSIESAGWQVVEASDGEGGVKKAVELLPDLVISDLMMPRKDGFEVVDELKNHEMTAHIPIILLTARSGIESRLAGFRRGADDYLTKPFSTEELLARMGNLVETRRRLQVLFAQTRRLPVDDSKEILPDFLSEHDREFLQKVNRQLEQNLQNEQFGVDDLASRLFISRSQLHRKLKALTDRAATDLIRDYRLDRAYVMLQNREGRVAEIAQRTGFVNEKHFSTVFRERFGFPPSRLSGKR